MCQVVKKFEGLFAVASLNLDGKCVEFRAELFDRRCVFSVFTSFGLFCCCPWSAFKIRVGACVCDLYIDHDILVALLNDIEISSFVDTRIR